jgi:carboxyl-terminal processing protease
MSRTTKLVVILLSFLVLSYVGLGYVLGQTRTERAYRPLTVFAEVLQHVQQDYVEEPNMQLVTSSALRGLLEALDPNSSYLSPAEYAEYKKRSQNGPAGRTGATLSKRFGYVVVISVLPESPADRIGLRFGDLIESMEGFTTREMSIEQAEMLMAGEPGTTVNLSVVRRAGSEPQAMAVGRAALRSPQLVADLIPTVEPGAEAELAYLRIPSFDAGRADAVRDALVALERRGARRLVLDLRDCASGDPREAIATARLLIPNGTIGSLRGQTVANQEFSAEPSRVVWTHPVVALISGSTSGAAEVLAAALNETGRGRTVGTRTFGTAAEQKLIPLEDGSAIVLTVAKYYSPGGTSIPDEGVAPSTEVAATAEDSEADRLRLAVPDPARDPALRKALELLRDGSAAKKSACRRPPAEMNARPARNDGLRVAA